MKLKVAIVFLAGIFLGMPLGIYLFGYFTGKTGRRGPEFIEGWMAAEEYAEKKRLEREES